MFRRDPHRRKPRPGGGPRDVRRRDRSDFVLYVEGARDREILGCWARRLDPRLVRCVERNTVILGGRQPARAISDFRKRGGAEAGISGLIVLDRDHHDDVRSAAVEIGLEVFVWSLRHIESYLLVPAAIRRLLRDDARDSNVERLIDVHLSADRLAAGAHPLDLSNTPDLSNSPGRSMGANGVHAKRILGAGGALSEALGAELRAGDIARAMRLGDLHEDVHALFDRVGALSGVAEPGPEIVVRTPTARDDPS